MDIFKIENLTYTYPLQSKPALENISFSVKSGEIMLILGQSGSGKTTLLNHLKTVACPVGNKSGNVYFNGKPLSEWNDREQSSLIGYVVQNPSQQTVTDKVWHEIAFGMENIGIPQKEMQRRAAETAYFFGIDEWFDKDISLLSGGQKQLLNLACVMAMHPKVLILDEPTSQLDPVAANDFLNAIWRINNELGTTVIMTEHRTENVFSHADKIIYMENGHIAYEYNDNCANAFDFPRGFFYLLPTPGKVYYSLNKSGVAPTDIRHGRQWLKDFSEKNNFTQFNLTSQENFKTNSTAVELKSVCFRYEKNEKDILKNTSVRIPKNSIFAVIGANGSGKSTFLKTICGMYKPYSGRVDLKGKNAVYLSQEPTLMFTCDSIVEDLKQVCKDSNKISRIAKMCDIENILNRHPYDVSTGQQQRAALAKIILTDADILRLDEVTKGLDGQSKHQLGEILNKLCKMGKTIILVSHDIEFCAQYSNVVGMFFDGTVIAPDTPQHFFCGNSFYTTAAARMSQGIFENTVSVKDVVQLCKINLENEI